MSLDILEVAVVDVHRAQEEETVEEDPRFLLDPDDDGDDDEADGEDVEEVAAEGKRCRCW